MAQETIIKKAATLAQQEIEKSAEWIKATDFEFKNNKQSMGIMQDSKLSEKQKKAKLVDLKLGRFTSVGQLKSMAKSSRDPNTDQSLITKKSSK